jgi:hypothetical protein
VKLTALAGSAGSHSILYLQYLITDSAAHGARLLSIDNKTLASAVQRRGLRCWAALGEL